MMPYEVDASKLKRWREERHWSQEQLAGIAGVGVRTIQRIENGASVSSETLAALASAYNVDIASIAPEIVGRKGGDKQRDLTGLRLSFWIHLASFVFCIVVFAAIGISAGDLFVMQVPLIWWFVGLCGHGLTVVIGTLAVGHQQSTTDEK